MNGLQNTGLSVSQEAAILDERPRVLVSAGAGSGKTALLVAYYVHALVDEGLPLERLIAVTFTRKAAAELASRIRSSLRDRGRFDLALSLDAAAIGTIHSFCRRLLREHALEAGVDPAFTVIEPEAAVLAKEEVLARIWARAVEEADEARLEMLVSQGDTLRKEVVPLYDRLRDAGQVRPIVAIEPGLSEERARALLTGAVGEALAAGGRIARPPATLESDLLKLRECLAWLGTPWESSDPDENLRRSETFFPGKRAQLMEPHFGPVRTALTRYRQCLAEARLGPLVTAMNDLLRRFHDDYTAYKWERSLLDFADLELGVRALADAGADSRDSVGLLPGSRIMIDEFQDTNELQCAILEGLGASRLLMVGDERQSIYRFRGADVEVFRRREAMLAPRAGETTAGGLHRLDVNYRSRSEVLAFINRLFAHEHFFGTGFVPLEHGRDEEDHCRQVRLDGHAGPAVEVLVAERTDDPGPDGGAPPMQEAEAQAVASCVRRLLDEEGWAQGQIVVLTPAQTHVVLYQQALMARGVDVYVVGGKGYYAREEVSDVTALLRLLVDPHDDLALVAVLRSPMVGLSDDGLYLLGRHARSTRASSLWEAARDGYVLGLGGEDSSLLRDMAGRLTKLRRRVGRPGLARLIDDAVSECGYDICLLESREGKRQFANVRKLMRMADDFETLEGPDLAGFVGVIQSMGYLGDKEGSAPTLAEGEDVVRVMTIHQAKGLEFAVVVLAGLGSDVPRGTRSQFVVGDEGRLGVFLKSSRRSNYEAYDLSWGPAVEIATEQRVRERDEDVRLLYVAMTRAKERLVLVGARPVREKMESCRIGRVALGLGLESLPAPGTTIPIRGLDAIVVGVRPAVADAEGSRRVETGKSATTAGDTVGEPPAFLEFAPTGTGPRRLSFSSLAAFMRCPRQFYLERVLGLELVADAAAAAAAAPRDGEAYGLPSDDPDVDFDTGVPGEMLLDESEASAGRDVGLLVHALLERSALDRGRPAPDLLRAVAVDVAQTTGSQLSEAGLERALLFTLAFWSSRFAGDAALAHAAREAPFFFIHRGVLITGIMDLMWRDGDMWYIVDYKTNSLEGRSAAEVAAQYDLQAAVYSLAALRAGARAVTMHFLFLERPEEPVTFEFGQIDLPRLEGLVDEPLGEVTRATFPERAGKDCAWCSVAAACQSMARP